MSIITNKDIIKVMLSNDGRYPGDPRVFAIYSYKNAFNGNTAYKLIYKQEQTTPFFHRPFCADIKLLWDRNGLTDEGKKIC